MRRIRIWELGRRSRVLRLEEEEQAEAIARADEEIREIGASEG